jgi:hypothetical protein
VQHGEIRCNVQTVMKDDGRVRTATIRPFKEPYKTIVVYQPRLVGNGKWGRVSIRWSQEMTAIAEQAEQFVIALQEAILIYRRWDKESNVA